MDAARATLARLLAAGRFSGVGTGGAAAAAAHHGSAAAAAAATPGVDPYPFGHGRAADASTTRIEAAALYDVFNPTDFVKEWTVDQVGRVADALVGFCLFRSTRTISHRP